MVDHFSLILEREFVTRWVPHFWPVLPEVGILLLDLH